MTTMPIEETVNALRAACGDCSRASFAATRDWSFRRRSFTKS